MAKSFEKQLHEAIKLGQPVILDCGECDFEGILSTNRDGFQIRSGCVQFKLADVVAIFSRGNKTCIQLASGPQ